MAEATASLGAGFTLKGTTPSGSSAPVYYYVINPSGQQTAGPLNQGDLLSYTVSSTATGVILDFNEGGSIFPLSNSTLSTVGSALAPASQSIASQLASQETTAPSSPSVPAAIANDSGTPITQSNIEAQIAADPSVNATTNTTNVEKVTAEIPQSSNVEALISADPAVSATTNITVKEQLEAGSAPLTVPPLDTTALEASLPPLPDLSKAPTTTDPSVPAAIAALDTQVTISAPPLVINEVGLNGQPTGNTITVNAPTVVAGGTETNTAIKPVNQPPTLGLTAGIKTAAGAATAQDQANLNKNFNDWRVRLSLAPGSNYLYNDPAGQTILQPLKATDGVIFPYTPSVTVNYAATYEPTGITHTNYTIHQYTKSSVDQIQLTCDFTAQDVKEANYLLAVIHFFRSMTKMFYGKDNDPKNGTPPPLCYIYGMGGYQFDALPLAISSFNYALPADVDYIKTTGPSAAGTTQPSVTTPATSGSAISANRLGTALQPGGKGAKPSYGTTTSSISQTTTWVPTKINISITCLPIMSRNQVSNYFSLKDYATGSLLQGSKRKGGGFW